MEHITRLLSVYGVSKRKEYWLVKLGILGFMITVLVAQSFIMAFNGASDAAIDASIDTTSNIIMVFGIWLEIAVTARRSADLGKTRWLAAFYFVPFVNLWLAIYLGFYRNKKDRANGKVNSSSRTTTSSSDEETS